MKLFYSPASPYVRKVMAVAHEAGLADRIELLDAAAHPINRDQRIVAHNPLGKVPCLVLDDAMAVFDSRVILRLPRHAARRRQADPGRRPRAA